MFERTVRLSGQQVAVLTTALSVSDKVHRHNKGSGDPSPFPKVAASLKRQVPGAAIISAVSAKLINVSTDWRERAVIRRSLDCLVENLESIVRDPERLHNVHIDIDIGELAACGVKLGRDAAGQLEDAKKLRKTFADSLRDLSHVDSYLSGSFN